MNTARVRSKPKEDPNGPLFVLSKTTRGVSAAVRVAPIRFGPVAGRIVAARVASRIVPVGVSPIARLRSIVLTSGIGPVRIGPITGALIGFLVGTVAPFRTGLALAITPLTVFTFQPFSFEDACTLPGTLTGTGHACCRVGTEPKTQNSDGFQNRGVNGHIKFPYS